MTTDPTDDLLLETVWDFDTAWARRIVHKVGEVSINLASIADLIAMKLALGRPQDLVDGEHLWRFLDEPEN